MAVVPPLPDTERRTVYTISNESGPFDCDFAVYGNGTDYENWLDVQLNGTAVAFTASLTSGTFATAQRPMINVQVTLTSAGSGTLEIIGADRPRRTVQVQEAQGVTARDFNQAITHGVARQREAWDKHDALEQSMIDLAALIDLGEQSSVHLFATRDAVALATIGATTSYIRTAGRSAVGDMMGSLLTRVPSEPSHGGKVRSLDRYLPNGTEDAANGGWWEEQTGDSYDTYSVMWFGAAADNTEAQNKVCLQAAIAFCDAAGGGVVEVPWPIDYGYVRTDATTHPDFSAVVHDMKVIDRGRGSSYDDAVQPTTPKEGWQERIWLHTVQTSPDVGQHDGNTMIVMGDWHPNIWIENTGVYAAQGDPSRAASDNLRTSLIYGYSGLAIWQLGMGQTKIGDYPIDDMFHYIISAYSSDGSPRLTPYAVNYLTGAVSYSAGSIATNAAHWFVHEPLVGSSVPTLLADNGGYLQEDAVSPGDIGDVSFALRNSFFENVSPPVDISVTNNNGTWDFKAPVCARATGTRPTGIPTGTQIYDISIGLPIWWNGTNWTNAAGTIV